MTPKNFVNLSFFARLDGCLAFNRESEVMLSSSSSSSSSLLDSGSVEGFRYEMREF
jgi:hypothetical protein